MLTRCTKAYNSSGSVV